MKKEAKKEKKEHQKALKPILSHLKKDEMKLEKKTCKKKQLVN